MSTNRTLVTGSGGAILNCLHTTIDPDKPSMLVALPFGVPASLAEAAFSTFAAKYNVVTWESRYVLNLDLEFGGDEQLRPEDHVRDMLCILAELGIRSCCLVGYCSGAGISLLAATAHPDVFPQLVLVNGEYQLFKHKGHVATDYQRSIDTFLPVVATGRPQAGLIFAKMAEIGQVSRPGGQSELDEQVNRPFSQEEYLFRYAKNYMGYRNFDALALAREVRQPTLVVAGRVDQHSNMENSEAVGACIAGATLFIDDTADHYAFCRPSSPTLAAIAAHLGV